MVDPYGQVIQRSKTNKGGLGGPLRTSHPKVKN